MIALVRRRTVSAACALAIAFSVASCRKPVDLRQTLEMADMSSGWFDVGVVNGRNKIVPSATFKLRKKTPVDLDRVSVNALFRAVDGKESELDNDVYLQRVDFASQETAPIKI